MPEQVGEAVHRLPTKYEFIVATLTRNLALLQRLRERGISVDLRCHPGKIVHYLDRLR